MIFHDLLFRFLFGASTLFFAAGTVVDAGAGADTAAAEDGAADTGGDTTVDDGAQAAEGDQAQAGAEGAEAAEGQEGERQTAKTTDDSKIDWRTVPQAVRNHLNEIKKTDPKLANQLQNAVYTSQTMLREVPGGLKEIRELKQIVDEAGGREEIQALRETHRALTEEQEDLDRRAASGDVSVLDNFAEIAGDGFSKLMPAALDRWMQKNPAEYSHAIGQIMVSAMQEGGVVSNLNMAIQLFGLNTPESIKLGNEALGKVTEYLNQIAKVATTVPERPKVDPAIAQQQTEIDNQKAQVFNDRFADRFSSWRNPEILNALSQLAPKGKQFSDYQRGVFVSGVVDELKRILTSDEDYTGNLQRVYNTRNMEDLLKFTKSRAGKLIPEAAKKVYRQLFSEATLGTAKPKPGVVPPKPAVQGAVKTPAVKGWVKVSQDKAPKPDEINLNLSPIEMRYKKAAILKDGRKLYWGERPPA